MDAWEQQPGEPSRWYARFELYRLLGPSRTIERTYHRCAEVEGLTGKHPDKGWHEIARTWQWAARAEAWDAVERQKLRTLEQERRYDAREGRLGMIGEMLDKVFTVMTIADLPTLEVEEARQMLPTMRLLFKDLLAAQRAELGLPVAEADRDEGKGPPVLNADHLATAQRELAQWTATAAENSPPAYDVFLSYAAGDEAFAQQWLLPRLRDAGVVVAVDVDTFRPGCPVLEEVERCVLASRFTVAVVSSAWVADQWSMFESLLRQHSDVEGDLHRLIPLQIEACELPRRLAGLQMVDMLEATGRDRQLMRVVKMVRGLER